MLSEDFSLSTMFIVVGGFSWGGRYAGDPHRSISFINSAGCWIGENGNLNDAYLNSKIVDVSFCENSELHAKAFDRAVAIKEVLNSQ